MKRAVSIEDIRRDLRHEFPDAVAETLRERTIDLIVENMTWMQDSPKVNELKLVRKECERIVASIDTLLKPRQNQSALARLLSLVELRFRMLDALFDNVMEYAQQKHGPPMIDCLGKRELFAAWRRYFGTFGLFPVLEDAGNALREVLTQTKPTGGRGPNVPVREVAQFVAIAILIADCPIAISATQTGPFCRLVLATAKAYGIPLPPQGDIRTTLRRVSQTKKKLEHGVQNYCRAIGGRRGLSPGVNPSPETLLPMYLFCLEDSAKGVEYQDKFWQEEDKLNADF